MRLGELCRGVSGAQVPAGAAQLDVRSVQSDSRVVTPGDLFVAVPGEEVDGREHAAQAAGRGAIAIVSQTPLAVPVPVVLVPDARTALAQLSAEFEGRPADRLRRVGITGTVGKTSVLAMLSAILEEAGIPAGTVGSLGIEHPGGGDSTANTTPGALELQRALGEMVASGVRVMAMEVTSHALVQDRIHGLTYDLGIFTNLTMLEHLEYHGSFRAYAEAKRLFLRHLEPHAPLIYSAGDRAVEHMVADHPGPLVGCGGQHNADVHVRRDSMDVGGSRVTLEVRTALPGFHDTPLQPLSIPLELAALGRPSINNASLAAVAALCLGANPRAVQSALAAIEPPRRRLQIVRRADPCIIDDTVGHPDSITGLFEVVGQIPHDRLFIVFCIRGQRGPVINARDAEALCIWARTTPVHSLVVTAGADTADERNRVTAEERGAFMRVLEREGRACTYHETLHSAIADALASAGAGDLVLLLGAQGMDAGAEIALAAASRDSRDP